MLLADRRAISLGVLELSYYDVGPIGARDTVVLLHDGAFGSDGALAWAEVAQHLAPKYRVLIPDLLGYGSSSKLAIFGRSVHEVNILTIGAFTRALCPPSSALHYVGSSFGGGLVLYAAAKYPEIWRITTGTSIGGSFGYAHRQSAFEELRHYDQTIEDAARITEILVSSKERIPPGHVATRHRNGLIPGHWEALSAARLRGPETPPGQRTSRESPADFLSACSNPLLLLEGTSDGLLEPGWSTELASCAKHAVSKTVEAGHCANLEQPEVVADLVDDFIKSVPES